MTSDPSQPLSDSYEDITEFKMSNPDAALETDVAEMQDLLASVYLYINWYGVTRNLTTRQKELFADAVTISGVRQEPEEDRRYPPFWWRPDYQVPNDAF